MSFIKGFRWVTMAAVIILLAVGFVFIINKSASAAHLWGLVLIAESVLLTMMFGGTFLPAGAVGRGVMRVMIGVFCALSLFFMLYFYNFKSGPACGHCILHQPEELFFSLLNGVIIGGYVLFNLWRSRLWDETGLVRVFCRMLCVAAALIWMFDSVTYQDLWDGEYFKYPWYRVAPFFKAFSPDERMLFTVLVQGVSLAFLIAACVSAVRFNKRQTPFWVAAAVFMIFLMSEDTFYLWDERGTLLPWTGHLLWIIALVFLTVRAAAGTFFPQGRTLWMMQAVVIALVAGNAFIWMQDGVTLSVVETALNLVTLIGVSWWLWGGCDRAFLSVCPHFESKHT